MSFRNPLDRIANWDDAGYLRANIVKFSDLGGKPAKFYDAIRLLQTIREGLVVLQQAGMLASVTNGMNSYKNAINWLRLNNQITVGVAVPAMSSLDDMNDTIADAFYRYVDWFHRSYLANVAQFQNAKLAIGAAKADKMRTLDLRAEEYSQDLGNKTEASKTVIESLSQEKISQLLSTVQTVSDEKTAVLRTEGDNILSKIEQAQALTIWHKAYRENITEYEIKLYGVKWKSVEFKNRITKNRLTHREGVVRTKTDTKHAWLKKWSAYYLLYATSRTIRFLVLLATRSTVWVVRKIFSLSGRRAFWFVLLGVATVVQALLLAFLLLNDFTADVPVLGDLFSESGVANLLSSDYIVVKIGIYLGVIAIPTLGYSFANKNYRIYSNLLDQYKHRATVAQTLQGILRNVEESEQNKDIRVNIVSVAAVAMFEMKNMGHLTKKDGDSSVLDSLISALTGGKPS